MRSFYILFFLYFLAKADICAQQVELPILLADSTLVVDYKKVKGFSEIGLIFNQSNPYLVYYSNKSKQLDLVNISKNTTQSIKLDEVIQVDTLAEGNLLDMVFMGQDSILLIFDNSLIGLTEKNIWYKKQINIPINDQWPHYAIWNFSGTSHALFDEANRIVYLKLTVGDIEPFKKSYFKSELLAALHVDKDSLEILPIFYPPYFTQNYIGDLNGYHIVNYKQKLLISYLATTDYQIFEYKSKTLNRHTLPKSNYDKKAPIWFKWNKHPPIKSRIDNVILNRIYDNILVLPEQNGLLRFFRNSIELKDENGNMNTIMEKPLTLMILDDSFKLKGEFRFPSEEIYQSYTAFVKNKKLYLRNNTKDAIEKYKIHFDVFDTDKLWRGSK